MLHISICPLMGLDYITEPVNLTPAGLVNLMLWVLAPVPGPVHHYSQPTSTNLWPVYYDRLASPLLIFGSLQELPEGVECMCPVFRPFCTSWRTQVGNWPGIVLTRLCSGYPQSFPCHVTCWGLNFHVSVGISLSSGFRRFTTTWPVHNWSIESSSCLRLVITVSDPPSLAVGVGSTMSSDEAFLLAITPCPPSYLVDTCTYLQWREPITSGTSDQSQSLFNHFDRLQITEIAKLSLKRVLDLEY